MTFPVLPSDVSDSGVDAVLSALAGSAQAIAAEASGFARGMMEDGGSTLGKVLAARSPGEAAAIQADYARRSYAGLVAEATRMSGLYADMTKAAYRPFEAMIAKGR